MANLMDLLQGQLSEGLVDQLSQQIGGADKTQTAAAASSIFSTLTAALAKNASTPEGASALSNALDRDHDGSVLDNVMDMLGGRAQPQNSRAMNGAGILGHLLGNKQNGAADMISQMSGLNSGQTGSLMSILAPMVMGALGKQKRQEGLDIGGLTSMLSGVKQSQQGNQGMDLISSFIDRDGDGSIVDDITKMGMNVLGKFLKK